MGGPEAAGRVRNLAAIAAGFLAVIAAGILAACAPTLNLGDPRGPGLLLRDAPPRPASDGSPTLRVVTFNVRFAWEIGGAIALLGDAPELRGADLVALQEMDDVGVRRIARALALNAVYYPASFHPRNHKLFGPALLTPWPVERAWKVLLPHPGRYRGQLRVATAAEVRIGDRVVRAYSVHLEAAYRLSEDERRDQVRAVLADAAGWEGPVVIAGDMNDAEVGSELESAGYLWATRDAGSTLGPLAYDHVFVRGGAGRPAPRAGTVDPRGASDHRAVWTLVRLR